jgi:hypothetical protein
LLEAPGDGRPRGMVVTRGRRKATRLTEPGLQADWLSTPQADGCAAAATV